MISDGQLRLPAGNAEQGRAVGPQGTARLQTDVNLTMDETPASASDLLAPPISADKRRVSSIMNNCTASEQ